MEAGEKELRKAFENVTTNNVKAILEHSNKTRKLIRKLEENIKRLENIVIAQNSIIDNFRIQLAAIQTQIYGGGTK